MRGEGTATRAKLIMCDLPFQHLMRGVGEVREEVGMFKIIRRCELRLAQS